MLKDIQKGHPQIVGPDIMAPSSCLSDAQIQQLENDASYTREFIETLERKVTRIEVPPMLDDNMIQQMPKCQQALYNTYRKDKTKELLDSAKDYLEKITTKELIFKIQPADPNEFNNSSDEEESRNSKGCKGVSQEGKDNMANPIHRSPTYNASGRDGSVRELLKYSEQQDKDIGAEAYCNYCIIKCGICCQNKEKHDLFKNRFDLELHLKGVHDLYTCQMCEKIYSYQRKLRRHQIKSKHTALKYSQFCDKEFKTVKQLQAHQLSEQNQGCSILYSIVECQYRAIDQLDLDYHQLSTHGTDLKINVSFKQLLSEDIQKLQYNRDPNLQNQLNMSDGIYRSNNHQYYNSSQERVFNLALIKDSRIKLVLSYSHYITRYHRYCLLKFERLEDQQLFELALLIDHLLKILPNQRVTQIFVMCDNDYEWFFSAMQFFKVINVEVSARLLIDNNHFGSSILMNRKTSIAIQDFIPRVQVPLIQHQSLQGNQIRRQIALLKHLGVPQVLLEYINDVKNQRDGFNNKNAKASDQAGTPSTVFKIIDSRALLPRSKLFDCCTLVPDWAEDTHYDGLMEQWHGDVTYCNPPFSVGAKFIAKALFELSEERSVILLLPQISLDSGNASRFFQLLGTVQSLGTIRFNGYKSKLKKPVSLVYLLAPRHVDFLVDWRRRNGQPASAGLYEKPQGIKKCQFRAQEKLDVASRLLFQGAPLHEVRKLSKLQMKKVHSLAKILDLIQLDRADLFSQ